MRLLLLGQQLKSLPIDFFENFLLVRKFIFQPEHRFFLALQRALGFCPLPPQLLEGLPNLSDFDFRLLHLFFKLLLDGTFLRNRRTHFFNAALRFGSARFYRCLIGRGTARNSF